MLALCLMLSGTYYAKNYAGIIGRGLVSALLLDVIKDDIPELSLRSLLIKDQKRLRLVE